MSRRYANPPRVLVLKYPARCAETGRPLPAGSTAWYVYATRCAYAIDSPYAARLAADQAARDGSGGDRFDMAYEDACAAACGL
jgi:hypothetical protein